ncbi:hypothetical protein F5141DRAFT_1013294 [Pisolithus sp. B1]|nr:hypothetical protein F5141DRAFT_1013294 [Pisolithus sp. B1]
MHSVTHKKVKKLLGGHKYYQNPCSTQLVNAIIHDKAHKVNEGHTYGEKLSLQQIQDLAKVDPKYQEMTQDEKDKLLHALTEYQALKNASIHATNSAVVCNVQSMLEQIFKILDGLTLQTGLYVCLFTTHGHVYDSSQPFWYRMDNVMDFWEDMMNVEPDELIFKLEQWACMQGKSDINLLGWLEGVPFQSPHAITSAEHLQTLCDALKAGTCHWAYMSRQQHLEYQDQLKEQ